MDAKIEDVCKSTQSLSLGSAPFKHYAYSGLQLDPVVQPIYNSTTYRYKTLQEFTTVANNPDYVFYSRLGTPNALEVEANICAMEGGAGSVVFASGMCAITTTLQALLKAGDHIVIQAPVYSGVIKYLQQIPKWNIEITYVPAGCDVSEYENSIKENTTVLYGETPCNPDMSILDLEKFGKLSQKYPHITTVVDGTFATPCLQRPLQYGIDISIHSCTKYLGGHSDILGGVATVRTKELYILLKDYRSTLGGMLSPFDCFLLNRGLKTLSLRMEKHCSNGMAIATFLDQHEAVKTVYYPGLSKHPQHDLAVRQMKAFGGMICFELEGTFEQSKTFVESTRMIHLAVSLGGPESLLEHVSSMVHGPWIVSKEERKKIGISDTLVRLSVGLEDVNDLIDDLHQALEMSS